MRLKILSVTDVAERHLCCGCGACAYLAPDRLEMVDDADQGRRPRSLVGGGNGHAGAVADAELLAACPGVGLENRSDASLPGLDRTLLADWGPVLRVWEGFATDPDIRFAGSSGGAATALALFCIERGGMHGVLHTAARVDVPYLNRTVLSTTRAQILANTGSRYAPASPCDGLQQVADSPAPCVFVGKPCDVAAAGAAGRLRSALGEKLGLTIGVFCAGTPSTRGTLEMLGTMGIEDPASLVSLRYRGNGWPGMATARLRTADGGEEVRQLTYDASWGQVLQKHRQWRCYVCPDHTGEFADVSVGDPWYRPIPPGEPGRSLVLARTDRGRRLVEAAIAAGYLTLEPADPEILPLSQPNLKRVRANVWPRALVCRLMGAAAPRYRGMGLFRLWVRHLSMTDKARSLVGTAKRVVRKGLRRRRPVCPYEPVTAGAGSSSPSHARTAPFVSAAATAGDGT